MDRRTWSECDLRNATLDSRSIRKILEKLGLKPSGANYTQIKKYLVLYKIDTSLLMGHAWNKGLSGRYIPRISLSEILVENSDYQSHKLKKRLFIEGIKKQECEICGWKTKTLDGRIPVELYHMNGVHTDNRIENLRILCPNCHSLQLTHRGKNINK